MKGIILLLFLFVAFSLSSQKLEPPVFKGKKVKIKKVLKKYNKGHKLFAVEFKYLKDYLLINQFDSTNTIELLGQPAKAENFGKQTVLVYSCFVNYEVAGYWNWPEKLYIYLDKDKRICELKSVD